MADAGKDRPAPAPAATDVEGRGEAFLSRWSRLKQEAGRNDLEQRQAGPQAAEPMTPPPELPPHDKLTFDSDYRQFFHPKVGEDVRRAALKKLFSDPRFNVMDGLDVYIDDYSKTEPIPAAMLAGLKQAQNILNWAKGVEDEPAKGESGEPDPLRVADAGREPPGQPEAQPGDCVAPGAAATESARVPSDNASGPVRS